MAAPRSAPGIRSRPPPRSPTPSRAIAARYRVDADSKQAKYAIIQAEDELASIGIVIGAGWNGARAFTATSGPGISLMQEFIGLAYFAEIPAVIFDVQRAGPSTGMPTRTQQSDVLSCAYASHGDTKHVLLFPEDPAEAFDMAALSFDLAERLQTPIFVMLDLDIGMNHRMCRPLAWDDTRVYDRGKVMTAEQLEAGREFGRYLDVDGDGIPYRTYPGTHPTKGSFFTRGTSRDRFARYTEEGAPYVDNMQRLIRKFDTAKDLIPRPLAGDRRQPDQIRRHLLRLDGAGDGRGDPHDRGQGPRARQDARSRLPVPFLASTRSSPTTTSSSWSSRTATRNCARSSSTNAASIRCGWCRSCTMTARRSPPASSPRRSAIISMR